MKAVALVSALLGACDSKVFFSETFGDGWENRWVLSKGRDSETQKMGKWITATGKYFADEVEDRGLQTAETMKFYGISSAFESFSNEGKDLIIQYQVKYEKDLSCGGGYIKVGPKQDDLQQFGESTEYNLMFGPDQCNADKRTHLIFRYKGKNHLKKDELPFKQEGEGVSHLYRLVLKKDSTVRLEVDQEQLYEGSLKDDWGLFVEREIGDPEDKKPKDWVDDEKIDDPEDKKPADWVTEKRIVDAASKKPEEWDEEEDGEWEPVMIDNPEFKGEWKAKRVANPEYKGKWVQKKIPNPEYVDDPQVYKYDSFGFVGVDVWQVKGGSIFDNIIITDDVAEADNFAKKWSALRDAEKAAKKKDEVTEGEAFERFKAARAKKIKEMEAADKLKAEADKAAGGGGDQVDLDSMDPEMMDDPDLKEDL